jgi:hypothetical protein
MKTNEPYKIRVGRINSLADLEREKERLQLEIVRKEEGIKYNYHSLVGLLSFRNLVGTLIEEVNATSTVIAKIVSLSKDFFAKRKKKKKARQEIQPGPKAEANDN